VGFTFYLDYKYTDSAESVYFNTGMENVIRQIYSVLNIKKYTLIHTLPSNTLYLRLED
jgi:hypothetical protein